VGLTDMNFQHSCPNKAATVISSRFVFWPEFLSTKRKLDDFCAIDAIAEHLKGINS